MYFKLSLKNVRKSFKDYLLYFLTLTFGVCIFYVFNSIESQQAMMDISSSQRMMMKTLTMAMGYVSVFVSIILGFLVVYANNFIIKRRKKEFGIYLTLGMEKRKLSRILVMETFIIGILSLAAGLAAGVFASQWMSVITAKLFEVNMTKYVFVFSRDAFLKTILYFGLIFIIVMAASTIAISRYRLITLINAARQNEKPKLRNTALSVVIFILSIACLAVAYGFVLKNGINQFDNWLKFEIILGSIGTFLFFASLSGFFLKLMQSNKRRYFKELNAFILRQINSKVNTAYISISIICLMLFCTIGIMSTGQGINAALAQSTWSSTPVDVTFDCDDGRPVSEHLKEENIDLGKYTDKYYEYSYYENEQLKNKAVLESIMDKLEGTSAAYIAEKDLMLIRLSDYNMMMRVMKKQELVLEPEQVALFSDYAGSLDQVRSALEYYIDNNKQAEFSGKNCTIYPKLLSESFSTSLNGYMLALVVPDDMVSGCKPSVSYLSFNCKENSAKTQDQLVDDIEARYKGADENKIHMQAMTKETVKSILTGERAVIAFVGIYLGIIFLITSAAILALQQLSEASDNRQRYAILRKIGADDKLINKTLFKQILIYFMLPLALACVHSVVGLKVANDAVSTYGKINAASNTLTTAIFILIVYGIYFLATYFGCKQMILKGDN